MPHISPPTTAVESSTPTVARTATGPLCRLRLSEVHVEGAREEQEPEHAVQEGFVEVDPPDQRAGPLTHGRHDRPDHGEDGGEEQRDGHQADRRGQPQQAKVQVAEQRHQDDQDRDQVELTHCRSLDR